VYGNCARLCPDAPVPVIIPKYTIESGGMAHNTFLNVQCHDGVEADLITNSNKIDKVRYVDMISNQIIVRVDSNEDTINRIEGLDLINFDNYDGVLISDYDKGYLTDSDVSYICRNHSKVVIDTKKRMGISSEWAKTCYYIKLNYPEFNNNEEYITSEDILNKVVITLGSKGCRHSSIDYPVRPVEVKDNSGAGDTFVACFMVELLRSNNIVSAVKCANEKATLVVQKKGVTVWS
jgi:D-beta-D-heptose 7-phosphate kinase/D-beta-D-heptose 1-phosphate adenosyltransferase